MRKTAVREAKPKEIKHTEDVRLKTTQNVEELAVLQKESQQQKLPEQKVVFKADSIKSRAGRRGAHNLPDQTNPPMGFDSDKAYDNVFPFLKLPYLQPNTREDVISFGSPNRGGHLDEKHKRIPLNAIFFGDNLHVLRAMPSNCVDLIYIDPPFFSGRNYNQIWGDDNEIRTFYDIWEDGLPSYLVWLNARLWEMRRVLKESGTIYVHCDWHASHYIKCEMDKIFGYENFQNDISWNRGHTVKNTSGNQFPRTNDTILLYAKSNRKCKFNKSYRAYQEGTLRNYTYDDNNGRGLYRLQSLRTYGKETIEQWRKEGKIYKTSVGTEYLKQYLSDREGSVVDSFWSDIDSLEVLRSEQIGYPTQKPTGLLQRIIETSTDEGDVVADFFMGGGTTMAVAQGLRVYKEKSEIKKRDGTADYKTEFVYRYDGKPRRFLGCDISRVACSVALNRLIRDAEEISGRTASINMGKSKKEKQSTLELTIKEIPDIRVYYLGVYPIEKFEFIDQKQFEDFVLTSYEALRFTGEGSITGVMNAATSILIGSVKPHESITEGQLKRFVEDVLRLRFQPNVRLKLKIISWVFPPSIQKYAKILENYFSKKMLPVEIELIPINSQLFRQRILEHYQDASKNEFLLKFISQPSIMDIACKKLSDLKYRFEAVGARSNNIDGYLINCQWDFNYLEGRFGEGEYALMREQKDGKYVAVLKAEKEFEKAGKYVVACRVQDNLGGEIVKTKEVEITK